MEVIRLFNGYYVIRSAQNSNMALSGAGTLLKLSNIGGSNNYSDVPMEAQWTLSGERGLRIESDGAQLGQGNMHRGRHGLGGREHNNGGAQGANPKAFCLSALVIMFPQRE